MDALLLLLILSVAAIEDRYEYFKEPVNKDVSITYADSTNKCATPILYDDEFMEAITRLNREKLPERVVHAKGTGAFGYFKLTKDLSKICKADFLNGVGKTTPIVVRFSGGVGDHGCSDMIRDSRGWSVRFYTEKGNFDILGFHTPVYFYKDPNHFINVVRAVKRRPDSNLYDYDTYWDAVTLNPVSLHFFVRIYADDGIPANYKNMPGHGIHTYQVQNAYGEINFVRFHFWPDGGYKYVSFEDSIKIGGADPDHAVRDLYEAIHKRHFPSWTVSIQIIPKFDCIKMGSRCIDVTRVIPEDKYPLIKIGKIVLNRNVNHFHNEIEKLALCPCNLVDGIDGAPDAIFESRTLVYRDTQYHRLGKNHNKFPINCPLHPISTYDRDGMAPLGDNEGDAINYYPNSFGGAAPYDSEKYRNKTCIASSKIINIIEDPNADNFDQVAEFYNGLTEERRAILIKNLQTIVSMVKKFIQKKLCDQIRLIHSEFGARLAKALNIQ